MILFALLLGIALFSVLVWGVLSWLKKNETYPTALSVKELLRRRYAEGKIDMATFQRIEKGLEAQEEETPRSL